MKKANLLILVTALAMGPSALAFAHGDHHAGFGPGMFDQIDTNSDGKITSDELHADVQRRFAENDLDKNGQVTEAEVEQHIAGKIEDHQEKMAEHLKSADKNGDGKWTKDELPRMPDAMFKKLDTNSDGALTQAELDAGRENMKSHRDEFVEHFFKRIDANGDGSIDITEANSFADAHFKKLDVNNDGVVTKDEWKAGHPNWHAHNADHAPATKQG
ncbi:MAG TPA: EF-hand domain-containing protein [Polyangiales bacterium]|jgi:Ca2+-binding EF-hand superfamily protein